MSNEIPRRNRRDLVPAEHKIQEAIDAVEGMGADRRLTEACMALGEASGWVSDFVDGEPLPDFTKPHSQAEAAVIRAALAWRGMPFSSKTNQALWDAIDALPPDHPARGQRDGK